MDFKNEMKLQLKITELQKMKLNVLNFIIEVLNDKNEIEFKVLMRMIKDAILNSMSKYDIDSLIFEYKERLKESLTNENVIKEIERIEISLFASLTAIEVYQEEIKEELENIQNN